MTNKQPGPTERGKPKDTTSYLNENSLPSDAAIPLKSSVAPPLDRDRDVRLWIGRLDL